MRWAVLVLAAGCRQIFGLDPAQVVDASVDTVDARFDDAQGGTCVDRWLSGPRFGAPVAPPTVNTSTQDHLPFMVADGTRLYYAHDNDIFSASVDNMGTLSNPMREELLSSGSNDGRVFVNMNQTRAFFSSNRPNGTGGAADLWRGFRSDATQPWSVDQMYLDNLNLNSDQTNPHLEGSLLHIYFASKDTGIMYADRTDITQPFGPATMLAPISVSGAQDDSPTLANGELVIVFASKRATQWDLYYATRSDPAASFGTPQPVPTLNLTNRNDDSPHITPDGCKLYFASDRNGSPDIYVATLLD
jgi:hypothetical protein